MVKVPLQNNKNWASSKCLVRKREKMCLPQILGMWNSKNSTSCAVMHLGFTYILTIQGKASQKISKSDSFYLEHAKKN